MRLQHQNIMLIYFEYLIGTSTDIGHGEITQFFSMWTEKVY